MDAVVIGAKNPHPFNAFLDRFHDPDVPSYPAIALEANALKSDEMAVTPAFWAGRADVIKRTRCNAFSEIDGRASLATQTGACPAQDEVSDLRVRRAPWTATLKHRSQTMKPRDARS
jgi:hypothetical protein